MSHISLSINQSINPSHLTFENFGGDIIGGSDCRVGSNQPVFVHLHAGSEVSKLHVTPGIEKHVVRLHVSMDVTVKKAIGRAYSLYRLILANLKEAPDTHYVISRKNAFV